MFWHLRSLCHMSAYPQLVVMSTTSVQQYGLLFVAAAVSGLAVTPVMRRLALRRQVIDAPDGGRKLQAVAVPYLGGLAIVFSASGVLIAAALYRGYESADLRLLFGVLIPGWVLALVGLADDIRGLSPGPRFLAQSAAAAVTALVLFSSGTGAQFSLLSIVNLSITIVWVVGVTNALNLIDNTDGVSSSVAGVAALSFFAMALVNGQVLVAAMSLALAGSCFGFLYWNKHPASIYMGDSGALFIGFLLAAIGIRIDLVGSEPTVALMAPLLVLAVPMLDTLLVIISRLRRGVSPLTGGLDHIAHRLRRRGASVPMTALLLAVLSANFGLLAVSVSIASATLANVLALIGAVAFAALLFAFSRLPDVGEFRS